MKDVISVRITALRWLILSAAVACLAGNGLAQEKKEKKTYSKVLVGDEFRAFWKGPWYYGGGNTHNPTYSGPNLNWTYSGNGPLPPPAEISIPLGEKFPIGRSYSVFVRNYYNGKMEVVVGDVTREITITRASPEVWTKCGLFEPNAPFDHVTLRYYPTALLKDTGAKQTQRYFVMGFYITTEPNKLPRRAGEIVDLLPEEKAASVQGNYIENASFEAGLSGWGKRHGTTLIFTSENLDDTTAADGKYSLKMSTDLAIKQAGLPFRGFNLETKLYRLPPDTTYTVSFYAKSDSPLPLTVEVYGLRADVLSYEKVAQFGGVAKLETDWNRYSFTGKIAAKPASLYTLRFSVAAEVKLPISVWLDGVQLEEDAVKTDFQIREDLQVGFLSHAIGNIFWDTEPCKIDVVLYNPRDRQEAVVKYAFTDYWDKEVAQGEKKLNLGGKKNDTFSLPLYSAKHGIYRLILSAENSKSEMVYSVLPPNLNNGRKYPEGTLGGEAVFGPYHLAVLKRANFSWVMSKSIARWGAVETEKGKFKWQDEAIRAADDAKLVVSLQPFLYPVPANHWLYGLVKPAPQSGKPWDKKPEYVKYWGEYLYQLVSHFKDSVKYWEIENEPNWEYSGQEYAEILTAAIENVKRADPQAKTVGFSGGGFDEKFFNETASAVDMGKLDIISVHFYGIQMTPKFAEFLKKFRKPGWNTETGRSCPSFYSTITRYDQFVLPGYWKETKDAIRERTIFSAKNYLQSLSLGGCERYFYYTTRFSNSSPSEPTWKMASMDLMEYDGGLRSSGVALSIGSQFMDGSTYYGPVATDEQLEMYLFRKGPGVVGFMWSKPAAEVKTRMPGGDTLAFYDIMGNRIEGAELVIGDSPIYFTSKDGVEKVEPLLKTLSRKP